MMKNKWILTGVAVCLLAACSQMTQEERFQKIAENENSKCPKRLNSTTVFDSTRYDASQNCVSYYYTLSGKADDAEKYKKNYDNFRKALDNTIINSLEMKAYLEYKTIIKYIYYSDSTKTKLAEFVFNEN
ncbi:MAG: hypothetical protein E7095_02710 [Bacteroides sp.]|nr:hypothetical protein [Bacteroides sp.]